MTVSILFIFYVLQADMLTDKFIELEEKTIPEISLTMSKRKTTGTATFQFKYPLFVLQNSTNVLLFNLYEIKLVYGDIKIKSYKFNIIYKEGKPFIFEIIFLFGNRKELFDFFFFYIIILILIILKKPKNDKYINGFIELKKQINILFFQNEI